MFMALVLIQDVHKSMASSKTWTSMMTDIVVFDLLHEIVSVIQPNCPVMSIEVNCLFLHCDDFNHDFKAEQLAILFDFSLDLFLIVMIFGDYKNTHYTVLPDLVLI